MTEELFTEKVQAGNRTYFFDVKRTVDGVLYLTISEVRHVDGGRERYRIMVFQENISSFGTAFRKARRYITGRSQESYIEKIRREYPRAYEKWTEEEDTRLREIYSPKQAIDELAQIFGRQPGAIRSRLRKLGLQ